MQGLDMACSGSQVAISRSNSVGAVMSGVPIDVFPLGKYRKADRDYPLRNGGG
jgi:hypothetical protein